ncbi:hypothetical protein [Pseudoalteromonas pernae]|uniref:hypothetical protein n=1 Tax=Pseudoalteromonas pernae TaxID=3118054 RepID=UPI00324257BC
MDHVLLPSLPNASNTAFDAQIEKYLSEEVKKLESAINAGSCSVSMFINLFLARTVLNIDNSAILKDFEKLLVVNDKCFAYTKEYTEQLHNFDNQYLQNDIYTEYAHWFLNKCCGEDISELKARNISGFIHKNGLTYNNENSDTELKYRMRGEVLLQTLMSAEILGESSKELLSDSILSVPKSPYISAEYFRFKLTKGIQQDEVSSQEEICALIENCKAIHGLADFNASQKFDDFMGTKKRTERDQTVFSPIATLHGIYLCNAHGLTELSKSLVDDVKLAYEHYGVMLPNFQMRDIVVPFGPGATVSEVLALNTILFQ